MTSKLHHAITALAIETNFNAETAFKWFEASNKNGLDISNGRQLYSDTSAATGYMAKKLKEVIQQKQEELKQEAARKKVEEKKKRENELAIFKKRQEQELVELQESHKREFEEKQKALEIRSVWNFSGLLDSNEKPATSSTSPASPVSYSTPSFKTVVTICDYCEREGHDMEQCWELHPELKRAALKNLKTHICNRCKRVGHHENSCFVAFPEKREAFLKWRAGRGGRAQN
jgi:hypothetical protein